MLKNIHQKYEVQKEISTHSKTFENAVTQTQLCHGIKTSDLQFSKS